MNRTLIYLWTLPTTAFGLFVVVLSLLTGGSAQIVTGVLEVHGGIAAFFLRRLVPLKGGASAMTLGHVVLGRDAMLLDLTRDHERVHVRQAERWGPAFLPAYVWCSVAAYLRGSDPYRDNPFEREAFERTS